MRVKFICMQTEKTDNWQPGRTIHHARLVPVVDDSPEAREYFAEPPTGAIELSSLASEHFITGHTYSVYFEELTAE